MPVPRRGAAFAASQLGKNSVGPKQLKKDSATTAKIKNSAVTTAKIKDGAVTGAKVLDGSLTGADINQATLTSVRASSVTRSRSAATGTAPITSCTESATVHLRNNKAPIIIAAPRTAWIFENASEPTCSSSTRSSAKASRTSRST
jgi:hypothetical protein